MADNVLANYENYKIRRHYGDQTEKWYFLVVELLRY